MRAGRPAAAPRATSRTVRAGQVLTGLVALFLLFDGAVHLARPPQVVDSFRALGYPVGTAVGIGAAELLALALYLVPRTAALGAVRRRRTRPGRGPAPSGHPSTRGSGGPKRTRTPSLKSTLAGADEATPGRPAAATRPAGPSSRSSSSARRSGQDGWSFGR